MGLIETLAARWNLARSRRNYPDIEVVPEETRAEEEAFYERLAEEEDAERAKEQRIIEGMQRDAEITKETRNDYPEEIRFAVDALRSSSDDPEAFWLACSTMTPAWFAEAMEGKECRYPDGPWPHFVRTEARIDWMTLLQEHPEQFVVDHEDLEGNGQPPFTVHQTVWAQLDRLGLEPAMDVDLWMDENGRIIIWPSSVFGTSSEPITAQQVSAINSMIDPYSHGYEGPEPATQTWAGRSSGQWYWY